MDRYSPDYNAKPLHTQAFGNAWVETYGYRGAAGATDKLYLGVIPAGVLVTAVRLITDAAGTDVKVDLGFEPYDAADGPLADLDAWLAAADIAAAGNVDSTAHPIAFKRPVKLVATISGAAFTGTPQLTAVVNGQMVGVA
ncbi:hypothetical protein [Bordetella bronchiseptica]|uniref:N-acetyltransferase YedL n=1 Tax=Bordetella bronchiseptica 00-P-2796 TaxID=1331199 RepID=A0ABR4R9X9_BORBO|nr:hypothetical protein [Bordetella bronchiseptica]KCV31848.1 hypothetical protein L490_5144 [Bordetella bronchiseptica 00-P-2796]KDC15317.1 hypothetical protein L542_2129 [Bordetella bronchiseptica F-1]KDC29246.1 hypothetical protein L504_2158 [Bordetella bronchiseptica F2]